jgi:CheY-like chemotaxis protein
MARILVVDDDTAVREATAALLSSYGHAVISFNSGKRIEDLVATHAPDVALIDVLMPDRDGLEIVIALRRIYPALPVLVVSGGGRRGNLDFLTMAENLGATATLAKPFNAADLLTLIDGVLGARHEGAAGS